MNLILDGVINIMTPRKQKLGIKTKGLCYSLMALSISFISFDVFSIEQCAKPTLFFINGMSNTFDTSEYSRKTINDMFGNVYKTDAQYNKGECNPIFNLSACGQELWEVARQNSEDADNVLAYKLSGLLGGLSNFGLSNQTTDALKNYFASKITNAENDKNELDKNTDLQEALAKVKAHIANGESLVLIGHSQGNFFTNEVYSLLTESEKEKVRITGIATPASHVAGAEYMDENKQPYVTFYEDMVMNIARIGDLNMASLPANLHIDLQKLIKIGKIDFMFHALYAYLTYEKSQNIILNNVNYLASELSELQPNPLRFVNRRMTEPGIEKQGYGYYPLKEKDPNSIVPPMYSVYFYDKNGVVNAVYGEYDRDEVNFGAVRGFKWFGKFYANDIVNGVYKLKAVDNNNQGKEVNWNNCETTDFLLYSIDQKNEINAAELGNEVSIDAEVNIGENETITWTSNETAKNFILKKDGRGKLNLFNRSSSYSSNVPDYTVEYTVYEDHIVLNTAGIPAGSYAYFYENEKIGIIPYLELRDRLNNNTDPTKGGVLTVIDKSKQSSASITFDNELVLNTDTLSLKNNNGEVSWTTTLENGFVASITGLSYQNQLINSKIRSVSISPPFVSENLCPSGFSYMSGSGIYQSFYDSEDEVFGNTMSLVDKTSGYLNAKVEGDVSWSCMNSEPMDGEDGFILYSKHVKIDLNNAKFNME